MFFCRKIGNSIDMMVPAGLFNGVLVLDVSLYQRETEIIPKIVKIFYTICISELDMHNKPIIRTGLRPALNEIAFNNATTSSN